MAHTPGPWIARQGIEGDTEAGQHERDDSGNFYWTVQPDPFRCGREYLSIGGWMTEANARLIAAAPELVEALKRLLPYFEGEHHPDHPDVVFARAALAKAGA